MSDAPAVRAREARYAYPDGAVGLAGVSLELPRGSAGVILGANGSGKSTFLQGLVGVLLLAGEVEVFGLAVASRSLADVRRRAGLVFQDPDDQLFCPTVEEDVAFGPRNLGLSETEVQDRVTRSLARMRLEGFARREPHRMSWGERKRAAIAAVLAMEPDLLLLDEPTSGLDPRSGSELVELLEDLRRGGKTVLATTQDLHLAGEFADRVYVFGEDRRLAREGAASEVLGDAEFLRAHNLLHAHRHRHGKDEHAHPHEGGHAHP